MDLPRNVDHFPRETLGFPHFLGMFTPRDPRGNQQWSKMGDMSDIAEISGDIMDT